MNSEAVLSFWFGELGDGFPVADRQALWFRSKPEDDAAIRERFGDTVVAAGNGGLEGWKSSARGCLALILLLDQFTRNIYRGTRDAFQFDQRARAYALEGLSLRYDQSLAWVERIFFYLPFEHSENLQDQQRSVALFTALRDAAPERHRQRLQNTLDYAIDHKAIVERFGRFPHRNRVLGRASTPEEEQYLRNAKTFGQ